jgi:hypothetical protein
MYLQGHDAGAYKKFVDKRLLALIIVCLYTNKGNRGLSNLVSAATTSTKLRLISINLPPITPRASFFSGKRRFKHAWRFLGGVCAASLKFLRLRIILPFRV